MLFGFAGAHRSGKTTLAKAVAETLGIHFHPFGISEKAKLMGYNSVSDLPIEERIKLQEALLDMHLDEVDDLPRPCITDRTPLDMIGYMMAEVTMHNTTEAMGDRIHKYMEQCLKATKTNFDMVIVTRPLPIFELDPKSPPPNLAYQWQHQLIVEGSAAQISDTVEVHTLISTDFKSRMSATCDTVVMRLESIKDEVAAFTSH
jgi:hypothetical protein